MIIHPTNESDNRTSNINWNAGVTVASLEQPAASSTGVDFYNGSAGTLQLIVDEFGYFATV